MYKHKSFTRVRYAETDQMSYVYYGNYAMYYEIGRVELIRSLGFSYKSLEESGIMLPVLELNIKYIRPALYDDELRIETSIQELPESRIHFHYEMYNQNDVLLNKGKVSLVFVSKQTMKPCKAPKELLSKLQPYFTT